MAKHLAPRPPTTPLRVFLNCLSVAAMLLVGLAIGVVATQALLQRRSPTDVVAGMFIEQPQAHFLKDRINVLLLGIDYNYDEKDQEYSANARSDTIMAVSLNFPTNGNSKPSIGLLSIPRDMDYVFPNGHEDKINSAYALGKTPADGAHRAERAVADFLGIYGFDRYVALRINATKSLIDAIGGIDVVPDETMDYDDHWGHLSIHFVGGKRYHMNGNQAVSYSRFRHDACGDPCRIKRQQQIIRITLAKLRNDRFNDFVHMNQLVNVIEHNVYTDITPREALSLAVAFQHIDLAQVKTQQVPYVSDKDLACCGNVIIADDAAKNALVSKLFLQPIGSPAPVDARAVAAIPASRIHVDVQNGSGFVGAAAKVADLLKRHGFVVGSVGDASSYDYNATEIHVHSTMPLAGERVKGALPMKSAVVEADATTSGAPVQSDVTVIVGRDYGKPPQSEASAVK